MDTVTNGIDTGGKTHTISEGRRKGRRKINGGEEGKEGKEEEKWRRGGEGGRESICTYFGTLVWSHSFTGTLPLSSRVIPTF